MGNMKAAQRKKRDALFLRGPVTFGWIIENIPDPTSRLILVAQGFMGMSQPKATEVTLTAKVWGCAGIESHDQRSRVTELSGVRAVLQCSIQATTQMKLHPNKFIGLILKARGSRTTGLF